LTPALTGLLAAGGLEQVKVYPSPRVAVVATGDEVIAPGHPLQPGQLYASNIVTLYSWLHHFGMSGETAVVRDRPDELEMTFQKLLSRNDALLTSGGAWKSERDLTTRVLDEMGWEMFFHRVRIGPGKAVALGILDGKPIFCLPGGPPSNEMAFLQIALPGLLQMAGRPHNTLPIERSPPGGGDERGCHMDPVFPGESGKAGRGVAGHSAPHEKPNSVPGPSSGPDPDSGRGGMSGTG